MARGKPNSGSERRRGKPSNMEVDSQTILLEGILRTAHLFFLLARGSFDSFQEVYERAASNAKTHLHLDPLLAGVLRNWFPPEIAMQILREVREANSDHEKAWASSPVQPVSEGSDNFDDTERDMQEEDDGC